MFDRTIFKNSVVPELRCRASTTINNLMAQFFSTSTCFFFFFSFFYRSLCARLNLVVVCFCIRFWLLLYIVFVYCLSTLIFLFFLFLPINSLNTVDETFFFCCCLCLRPPFLYLQPSTFHSSNQFPFLHGRTQSSITNKSSRSKNRIWLAGWLFFTQKMDIVYGRYIVSFTLMDTLLFFLARLSVLLSATLVGLRSIYVWYDRLWQMYRIHFSPSPYILRKDGNMYVWRRRIYRSIEEPHRSKQATRMNKN